LHGRAGLRFDAALGLLGRGVSLPPSWLVPTWTSGAVGALMSAREGGVSDGPFASMNLGAAVGDAADRVALNRARFAAACAAKPVYLRQVHGRRVVRVVAADASPLAAPPEADASVTIEPGVACTVQAADCLPVLLAAPDGRAVAAAHAGWRGLAGGVVEATVAAVCAAAGCAPDELEVWLGACIGPRRYEVGSDVVDAFASGPLPAASDAFRPSAPGKWLADLPALARARLAAAGVGSVTGGDWCTVEDASRFFSFRRDRVSGRMAAAIWICSGSGRG
jgi:polyphenol oxidase